MTLLSIANDVADETNGPRPPTVASNTNPESLKILRLINKVGKRLMKIFAWSALQEEHTFTASGDETVLTAANLPGGFHRLIPETFWDRDSDKLISGPVSPVEWSGLKVQTFSSETKKCIRRAGAILTQPVIDSGTNLAFMFVSKNWADIAAGGSAKSAFSIDTDVALLDEEMIIAVTVYEWLKSQEQPYLTAAKAAKDAIDTEVKNDAASVSILVAADIFARNTRHFGGAPRLAYGVDF